MAKQPAQRRLAAILAADVVGCIPTEYRNPAYHAGPSDRWSNLERKNHMESVRFINCEDDGTDQIVSFALARGDEDVRSLILLRTPKYEAVLDEAERGVSVSLEDETGDDADMITVVKFETNRIRIETRSSKYDLDISRVDPAEVSEMKALIGRMNFDAGFRIEDI